MAAAGVDNEPQASGHAQKEQSIALETTPQETLKPAQIAIDASDITSQAKHFTDRILDFLSHASNETLGACIIALGATTWLILGRVGLVLIGVVGGVFLHATWESGSQGQSAENARATEVQKRREKGLDIAARVLDWRERRNDPVKHGEDSSLGPSSRKLLDFSEIQPDTGAALNGLTDAIIRDYVKWWYSPVLPAEEVFPTACRDILTGFMLSVSSHLSRKRPVDTFLDFLTNSSSIVIVFLSELSSALRAPDSSSNATKAIHAFLEANPSCSLANVLDTKQQKRKLGAVAEDILSTFLDPKVYNCQPARVFLREILANVVLTMTITSCSRPEFINGWIIYSLEETDTELLKAIDSGVGEATVNRAVTSPIQSSGTSDLQSKDSSSSPDDNDLKTTQKHKRTFSRAEVAMEKAMQEAKRLSELIAMEEAKKSRDPSESVSSTTDTPIEITPMSSRDDLSTVANGLLPAKLGEGKDVEKSDPIALESSLSAGAESGPKGEHEVVKSNSTFTSFDQIVPSHQPTALRTGSPAQPYIIPPLTLYNASVSIFDDSVPGEKVTMRSKPTTDYLLQIEPATSQYPGWMIARKYSDFETLHEVLRRISVVSGVTAFAERHQSVPSWKNRTKAALRSDLEHYLRDSLSFQRLAESEGIKRFLEKDQGHQKASSSTTKGGFGFPSPAAFETMGKGMLDVLASAPKGAAGGGKAILGGVTGVLGGVGSIGQKKQPSNPAQEPAIGSRISLARANSEDSSKSSFVQVRDSQESPHPSISILEDSPKPPPLPRRPSQAAPPQDTENNSVFEGKAPELSNPTDALSESSQRAPSLINNELHLPPPPSEISDDYTTNQTSPRPSLSNNNNTYIPGSANTALKRPRSPSHRNISPSLQPLEENLTTTQNPTKREPVPLNSQETSVAVELFFAIINELYTLSSAWTLRLTLLNAAKSFLLRPGNPNLEAIRVLLQSTIIDTNTTDAGIAAHIKKLRENALPTEDELKASPPPPIPEEKERMRIKARKLLVEKGMPQALTSVMGAAASGEALGKVFDCLQVPEVAKGLVFALVLQGVRAVTQ